MTFDTFQQSSKLLLKDVLKRTAEKHYMQLKFKRYYDAVLKL